MNASRFSLIENTRDVYAEDIVIQKVIYYISLFQKEVYDQLHPQDESDQLGAALEGVEAEQEQAKNMD